MDQSRPVTRWLLAGVFLATVLAYQGVRHNGWVYEDAAMEFVAAGDPGLSTGLLTRNAARLSVYLPGRVFGPSPQVQHLVGLGLHLVNGLLVWWFLRRWLSDGWTVIGTAIFLWAPIQVETAAYVASRPDLLMTTGLLTALNLLADIPLPSDRRPSWRRIGLWFARSVGIVLACELAIAAKQTGVVVLPLLVLLRWVQDQERRTGWAWAFVAVVAAGCTLFTMAPVDPGPLPYGRLGTMAYQSAAFWRMVSLVIVPWGLTIDHNIGATPPVIALAALMGVGLVLAAAWSLRQRQPIAVLVLLWPLLFLVPRFVLSAPEFYNEHQVYASMPAICVGLTLLAKEGYAVFASERRSDIRVGGDQSEPSGGWLDPRGLTP